MSYGNDRTPDKLDTFDSLEDTDRVLIHRPGATKKLHSVDFAKFRQEAQDIEITKEDVGLGNVDNTSDANKPVSTAQQAALDEKQYKAFVTVGFEGADYICDGVDDHVQIQAAIDYVSSLGGGVVRAKIGTYDIDRNIDVPPNVVFRGNGVATKLVYRAGRSILLGSTPNPLGSNNSAISDMWLDGASLASTFGVQIFSSQYVRVERLKITTMQGNSVRVSNSHNIRIRDLDISNTVENAVSIFAGSTNVECDRVFVDGAQSGVIIFGKCNNIRINGCDIRNTTIGGFRLTTDKSSDIFITNNNLVYNLRGIAVTSAVENLQIIGNTFAYSDPNEGLTFSDGGITKARIIGNTFYRNQRAGAIVRGTYHTILGNTFFDNGQIQINGHNGLTMADASFCVVQSNISAGTENTIISLMTSNASSGQKQVTVSDGSIFRVAQYVTISDDTPLTENNQIESIDGNVLTMVDDLVNTYATAQNAKVAGRLVQSRGIRETGTSDSNLYHNNVLQDNITASLTLIGANSRIVNENSIVTGTAAPATTPTKVGDEFIDTTNKNIYKAVGTASSADWVQVNN